MGTCLRLAVWAAPATLAGCHAVSLDLPRAEPLGEQLAREVAAQLSLPAFVAYVAAAAIVAALLVGLRLLLVSVWRLGFDAERRLALLMPVAKVLSAAVVLAWLAARWSRSSPHLLVFFFPVTSLGLLWIFAGHVRNLSAGALLMLTRRIRQGDRVQVGGHGGVVREVGLGRTVLRRADGSRVYVPNQDLLASTLTVARERLTEPVELVVPLGDRDGSAISETARRLALLCPYRAPGTAVSVGWDPTSGLLRLRLHAWSEGATLLAERSLRSALATALQVTSGLPERGEIPPAAPGL